MGGGLRLADDPVRPLARVALHGLDLQSELLRNVPADESANTMVLPVCCLRDLRESCAFFALHQFQHFLGLATGSDRALHHLGFPVGLLWFRGLLGLTAFLLAFAVFLLAFVFFGFGVCVVVSLIVFSFVECIGRHIHHSGSDGLRGERPREWSL